MSLASFSLITITILLSISWLSKATDIFTDNDEDWDCRWYGDKGTYDLCDFELSEDSSWGYYEVADERKWEGNWANYGYYFNVAKNVKQLPPSTACYNMTQRTQQGLADGYCTNIEKLHSNVTNATTACDKKKDIIPITTITAAYQIQIVSDPSVTNAGCWRLHDGVTAPKWEHLISSDPAYGVKLTYSNGDFDAGCAVNREFSIRMLCNNDIENVIDRTQNVTEPELCYYAFEFATNHGCPVECPIVNDALCNGKGVCDYDNVRKEAKCFCYNSFYGDDCSSRDDPDEEVIVKDSTSAYVGALVVVILLLFVIVFILGYLFLRKSKIGGTGYIDNKLLMKIKRKTQKGNTSIQSDEYDD